MVKRTVGECNSYNQCATWGPAQLLVPRRLRWDSYQKPLHPTLLVLVPQRLRWDAYQKSGSSIEIGTSFIPEYQL